MLYSIINKQTRRRATAAIAGVAMVVGLIGVGAAPHVHAQQVSPATIASLQAQIASLQAQIAALHAGTTVQVTFTRNLTLGSTGEDVRQLQIFLNQSSDTRLGAFGPGSPGQETSYFGPLTRNAVVRFQAKHASDVLLPLGLTSPTGFWGPSSRAKANALIQASQPPVHVPGNGGEDEDDDRLQGGAGSLDDVDFISRLNNEEVGEGAKDVAVVGLKVEADEGSDIEISAVRVDFDKGSADRDFRRYADKVSIWLDGTKYAEINADRFSDDNDYTRTVSLDRGAIIRAGDEADLTVRISALRTIDSADLGETWNVTFQSIRFRDAQNAIITDSGTGDIGNARTFSFESFASAANAEFRVGRSSNDMDSRVVNVDSSNDTDNVELLRFEMSARGDSDLRVRDLPITLTVTGATDVDHVVNTLYITMNGTTYSKNVNTNAASQVITLDDFDEIIDAGDTVEIIVRADINNLDSTFDEGDTLKAEYTTTNRANTDVEDENGDDLSSSDRTGTALGKVIVFYDKGIFASFENAQVTVTSVSSNASAERGNYKIVFDVEAFDSDVFIAKSAATSGGATAASSSLIYSLTGDTFTGTQSANVTWSGNSNNESSNGHMIIKEGETRSVTLTVILTNSGGSDGFYGIQLDEIRFAASSASDVNNDTSDTSVWTSMTAGLSDYDVNDEFLSS
ncbi:MAG: peptidoglycan-binding protein [Candidatus Paceibacterota bacterium]